MTREYEAQAAKVNDLGAALARLRAGQSQFQPSAGKVGAPPPALDPNALALAQAAYDAWLERVQGGRTIIDDMNLQWQTHADIVAAAQQKIAAAMGDGVQARIALSRLEQNLNKQEQEQILSTASLAAQTITSLFPKQKGAAVAAAVINTAVGITRALSTLLPPWSWIQAGLIAASGAAQIATINSTTLSGGASPTPTGAGAGASAEPEAPTRMLAIQGLNPDDLFSGGQVRGLIDRINTEVQNGVTLISTRSR